MTQNVHAASTVIVRSRNCLDRLTTREKEIYKLVEINGYVFIALAALICFYPTVGKWLEGRSLQNYFRRGGMAPWYVVSIAVGCLFFLLTSQWKKRDKIMSEIAKYKNFCAAEVLMVCAEGIYGSTEQGSLQLDYSQIADVSFHSVTIGESAMKLDFSCEHMKITDVAGNVFQFYSFENCNELKACIDKQRGDIK